MSREDPIVLDDACPLLVDQGVVVSLRSSDDEGHSSGSDSSSSSSSSNESLLWEGDWETGRFVSRLSDNHNGAESEENLWDDPWMQKKQDVFQRT